MWNPRRARRSPRAERCGGEPLRRLGVELLQVLERRIELGPAAEAGVRNAQAVHRLGELGLPLHRALVESDRALGSLQIAVALAEEVPGYRRILGHAQRAVERADRARRLTARPVGLREQVPRGDVLGAEPHRLLEV